MSCSTSPILSHLKKQTSIFIFKRLFVTIQNVFICVQATIYYIFIGDVFCFSSSKYSLRSNKVIIPISSNLLKKSMMSESAYDFLVAFELNSGIAQTFVQRALVLSFQKKYSQIIGEYNKLTYSEKQEDPALHMLVAKAKLKCGDSEGNRH